MNKDLNYFYFFVLTYIFFYYNFVMYNKETDLQENFHLPIEYLQEKSILEEKLLDDLDMTYNNNSMNNDLSNNSIEENREKNNYTIDKDKNNITCCYDYLFSFDNSFNKISEEQKIVSNKQAKYITKNTEFLRDFQKLIKQKFFLEKQSNNYNDINTNNIDSSFSLNTWFQFKNEKNFLQKYQYVEWKHLEKFNKHPIFLQGMTLYNLSSPVLQLSIPVLFAILPFFIIKFVVKKPLSFQIYKEVLFTYFKNHSITRFFTQVSNSSSMETKVTASFTIAFFIFSMYQNCLLCLKFYKNIFKINDFLYKCKLFLSEKINLLNEFIETIEKTKIKTFERFHNDIVEKRNYFSLFLSKFDFIQPKFSLKKIGSVGSMMSLFYDLYKNDIIHENICFIFGLNGFIHNLSGLYKNYREKYIHTCKFSENNNIDSYDNNDNNIQTIKPTKFKNQYYIFLKNNKNKDNKKVVENSISLYKNYIITGPNASGKTTLLKCTLLNIIFSQQFGFGCYKNAFINPYDNLFCYINIPDTNGRDSLFQSEARQSLDILQKIEKNNNIDNKKDNKTKNKMNNKNTIERKRYFCVFDELFSGTNPEEATISAKAYLHYLCENKNIDFMITTHYYNICDLQQIIDKNNSTNIIPKQYKQIENIHLETYLNNQEKINNIERNTNENDESILENREKQDKNNIKNTNLNNNKIHHANINKFIYTYKIKKGISKVKGGLKVLVDLHYPEKVLQYLIKYNQ